MNDPVIVEVTRGGIVESVHRGAVAVVDAADGLVLGLGEIDRPVFPRSAVKALQALPLMESGAAERFGLTAEELALACSSHSGEVEHAATAERMLVKAGQTARCLECGAHWPMGEKAARALARAGGEPTALHNNCSGKHAGFVCASVAMGVDPQGYIKPEHPLMRAVTDALETVTGASLKDAPRGIDGCSIPTYALPLKALARGFARFGTGTGFAPARAAAAEKLRAAVAAAPFFVAGTGRFDTRAMEGLGARAFIKTGAEGVYCASLPEVGLGIALKIDDGATRASETVMADLLRRFLPLGEAETTGLAAARAEVLRNWNGYEVGTVRAALTSISAA